MKKNIVISAINFHEGGPLTVFKDCLSYLSSELSGDFNIIALVSNKDLFGISNITYYEFPKARRSWLNRLYYEYYYFINFSKKIEPYLWLSLHDMTPNVCAEIRAVYCHNPAPFYKPSFSDLLMDPRFVLFTKIYKFAYQINIKKNKYIVVQQNWIRDKFISMFGVKNVIVSLPNVDAPKIISNEDICRKNDKIIFIYPAFPRCFKNIEVICEAAKILNDQGIFGFEVLLTIKGDENRYSKSLYQKYNSIRSLKFIGILKREKLFEYYCKANCLIFPSKLETWGLPITEFKLYKKPILLADLGYAYETIGEYDKARFFQSDNPKQLAELMKNVVDGSISFGHLKKKTIAPPFASNWKELFSILIPGRTRT